jgi:CheY-like chemotaxis protein
MARKILIVDDEDDIREVAQMSLEMVGGWQVVPARSGAQAIELAAREQPDAILLDVMMPGMDGPTTFEHLQAVEETRDIPVIFLTAKVQGRERRTLDELGVRGVIPKPFDPITLPGQVSDVLNGQW